MELLPASRWETCHELTFELYHGLYICRVMRPEGAEETLAMGEQMLANAANTSSCSTGP